MEPIIPMEPQSSDRIPQGDEWIYQVKWDGVRIVTYATGGKVELRNRKLRTRTQHYPELTAPDLYSSSESMILDGEIIALGPDGKPSFHEVMRRDGIRIMSKVEAARKAVPITYMVFDILYLNGQWLTDLSWIERNRVLQDTLEATPNLQLVESHTEGERLFEVIKQHGMEGIVAKRTDSPYLIGEKKGVWLKKKNYRDLIAVIGGYTLSGGIVNAVLLGLYDEEGQLLYIGHTGTGKLTHKDWRDLTALLRPLTIAAKPFANKTGREREATWVRPVITVKIQYAEWTEGHALRQPSIQAFVDIPPSECVLGQ